MDNDTLDSIDQLKALAIATLRLLCGFAPATVEKGVGRGNPRRGRGILALHDADEDIDGFSGVAARQRADFGESPWHLTFHRLLTRHIRTALYRLDPRRDSARRNGTQWSENPSASGRL